MARHSLDNGSQAQAAGYKNNLFPANHNLGRSGRYHSSVCFTTRSFRSLTFTLFRSLDWTEFSQPELTLCLITDLLCKRECRRSELWSRKVSRVLLIVKMPSCKMPFMIHVYAVSTAFTVAKASYLSSRERYRYILLFNYLALYRLIQRFIDYTGIKHGSSLNHYWVLRSDV